MATPREDKFGRLILTASQEFRKECADIVALAESGCTARMSSDPTQFQQKVRDMEKFILEAENE